MTVQLIPLSALHEDDGYQPRYLTDRKGEATSVKEAHVRALLKSNPEDWPPIVVTPTANGEYLVIDGLHRLEAARRLKLEALPAVIEPNTGGYERAFALNRQHGLPLKLSDRKVFARWLAHRYPHYSLDEISRQVGINLPTVAAALKGDSPRCQRRDTPEMAALSLCKAVERLWVPPRSFEPQPARVLGRIFAKVARERWGAGAERMLAHLKAIVAAAEEALYEPQ
jgi:hypothetical protein